MWILKILMNQILWEANFETSIIHKPFPGSCRGLTQNVFQFSFGFLFVLVLFSLNFFLFRLSFVLDFSNVKNQFRFLKKNNTKTNSQILQLKHKLRKLWSPVESKSSKKLPWLNFYSKYRLFLKYFFLLKN